MNLVEMTADTITRNALPNVLTDYLMKVIREKPSVLWNLPYA